jgi:hypothetical protein
MSSVNQGLSWEAGDTLGWGKAQGRAKTSALWTPSSWKPSPCHDLLKEQPSSECQAPPHRPAEPLLCRLWDLRSFVPAPQPHQAHMISARTTPLRTARATLHRPARLPQCPWGHAHLPHATGGLQTCLGDTDR